MTRLVLPDQDASFYDPTLNHYQLRNPPCEHTWHDHDDEGDIDGDEGDIDDDESDDDDDDRWTDHHLSLKKGGKLFLRRIHRGGELFAAARFGGE